MPWKRKPDPIHGDRDRDSRRGRLQFGHGCDAVETMAWASPLMATITRLQFGHGCDAVETMAGRSREDAAKQLQFGHGCDAVETAGQPRAVARSGRVGFNSATAVM